MKTPKKDDLEYFFAVIGPVSRKKLDKKFPNGEGRLRSALQNAFYEIFPYDGTTGCASGWGIKQAQREEMFYATCDDELKKTLIESYKNENKPLPRALRAWQLLFNEEQSNENV